MGQRALVDGQACHTVGFALLRQVFSGGSRQRQSAKGALDDRLPNGRHAKEDFVCRVPNRVSESDRQFRVGADVPKENVRVEQQPHEPSNSFSNSSGRGWSKSAGTVNWPAQSPNGRGSVGIAATGRTSASGRSSRTTRKASPASTRRRKASGSR